MIDTTLQPKEKETINAEKKMNLPNYFQWVKVFG